MGEAQKTIPSCQTGEGTNCLNLKVLPLYSHDIHLGQQCMQVVIHFELLKNKDLLNPT